MLDHYSNLVTSMQLEGIIQMIAHVKTITNAETSAHAGRVELWQKLQLLVVTAFEWRHEDYEHSEKKQIVAPPLNKESIMILANVMIANETSGHLRDHLVINYLFKSVFEIIDFEPDFYTHFTMQDIATLLDAFYKS